SCRCATMTTMTVVAASSATTRNSVRVLSRCCCGGMLGHWSARIAHGETTSEITAPPKCTPDGAAWPLLPARPPALRPAGCCPPSFILIEGREISVSFGGFRLPFSRSVHHRRGSAQPLQRTPSGVLPAEQWSISLLLVVVASRVEGV